MFLIYFGSVLSDIQLELGKIEKTSIKTHFIDHSQTDVLITSKRRPTADASLGVTYRTIWGRPQDVRTFLGDVRKTSAGRKFAEWVRAGKI